MALTPEQLDELYTELCHGMTEAGGAAIPQVLARLCLLLMHEVGDAGVVRQAIREALADAERQRQRQS